MTGGGEGERGKIDWPLVISIAALLFGVVQFVREMNDDGQEKALKMEARMTALESDKRAVEARVGVIECQIGMTCKSGGK